MRETEDNLQKIRSIFKKENVVRYYKNEYNRFVTINNITFNENMKVPIFEIAFESNRFVNTTKEFIFHEVDIDFASILVLPEQLMEYQKFYTK